MFSETYAHASESVLTSPGSTSIRGAAHAGHFRSKRLGNLHGKGAHASRRAVDQDLLAGPDPSAVAKTLQRGEPRQAATAGARKQVQKNSAVTRRLIALLHNI